MSAALYWWRATWRSSWRAAVTVALLSGLLGAVALAALAATVQAQAPAGTGQQLAGLSFNVRDAAVIRGEVQQAIRPQAAALTVFGGVAGLALLVLAGQSLAQLLSRSGPDLAVAVALGASRGGASWPCSRPWA